MSLYKIKRFKTFFDKNNTDNLIILENIYNTLYSCEDLEFELKQSENEYSKYNTLLISSILFIFVGVFVLDFWGLLISKIIYLQKVYL